MRLAFASRAAPAALLAGVLVSGCGGSAMPATVSVATPAATSVLYFDSQEALGATPAAAARNPGAASVFTGTLFRRNHGPAVGRYAGACVRTAAGPGAVFSCQLSYVLPGGVIYGQSLASSQGPADGAVTGGTGAYANVRGSFRFAAGQPLVHLSFRLAR